MRIRVVSFTEKGQALGQRIFQGWDADQVEQVCRHQGQEEASVWQGGGVPKHSSLKEWARIQFQEKNALVFIGACGIAVRTIAPFVQDKLLDSPVLCVDEGGQFVIPLLSGHVGGANELAAKIARRIGAFPVITTATDVNETFAVDLFAKQNHLTIQNKEAIGKISAKVLEHETVDIVISRDLTELSHGILRLKPKEYVLGIGCRKGKSYEELAEFVERILGEMQLEISEILAIASIDLKKEEEGILRWVNCNRVPFQTFTAEELLAVDGEFSSSEFVKGKTGVDNVCERAAMKVAGTHGQLIMRKHAENGMTLAIAWKPWKLDTKHQKGVTIDEA